jgi:hypothetical protein
MAHSTLPVFSLPHFPQVFDSALFRQVRRVERLLVVCCFSNEQHSCRQTAIASDLETGAEYCAIHIAEVNRG